jgi:hypothetical protein
MAINLTLEVQEIELILSHLNRGIKAEVDPLFDRIRSQAVPQAMAEQQAQTQAQAAKEAAQAPVTEIPVVDVQTDPLVESA